MITTFTTGIRHSEYANTACGKPTATEQNETLSSDEYSCGESWPNNTAPSLGAEVRTFLTSQTQE
jgi:hypothetical protein